MRILGLLVLLICFSISLVCEESIKETEDWSDQFSFVIGTGASYSMKKLYEIPIIDKATKNVKIDVASYIRPNLSLGITYTPVVWNVVVNKQTIDEDGNLKDNKSVEYVPKGISYALFINPASLVSGSDGLKSIIDLGLGIGYRNGDLSIYGTVELFGINQPRNYFIDTYSEGDKQYMIDGDVQTSFSLDDESIFKTKIVTSIGVKIAYSFDIITGFKTQATNN